jgi:importin subunit beta-1
LKSLSEILKNGTNSPVARMQAGLQLKNALYSKDAALKVEYQQRWLQFAEDVRNLVKLNVSCALDTW